MAAELQTQNKASPFSFLFPRSSCQLPLLKPHTKLTPLRTRPDMSSIPQPTALYPHPLSASAHSSGTYGPVFAVLAVIAVLSITACVVTRLCARRACQPHGKGDVENRFESSGVPAGKLAKHGARSEAAKHAESNGAMSGGYVGGSAGGARGASA